MKKILVFGASGSGKSTFSNTLGKKLDVPVYHLDSLSLDASYRPLSLECTTEKIHRIINSDAWIIDGQYSRLLYEDRLREADTVILLDLPLRVSFWRSLKRFWMIEYRKKERIG